MYNEEVLAMFRDYYSQWNGTTVMNGVERPLISDEHFEASMAAILTFAKRIDPVTLAESTIAELEEFRREMLKAHDRNALLAIEAFRSFRGQFLRKSQKAHFRFGRLV